MAKIEGWQKLVATLRARAAKVNQEKGVSVTVGFTASYAIFSRA